MNGQLFPDILLPTLTSHISPLRQFYLQLTSRRGGADGRDLVIQERGEEVGVVLAGDLGREVLAGECVLVSLGGIGCELLRLLLEQAQRVRLVDLLALGRRHAVTHPLP